jgi:acetyltransferase
MDGISKVASIGNKLDVDELDLLNYLIEDPETRIIVLYLESLSDGRKLVEYARRSAKPMIVLKSNISGKASQIALSHTAALASDDRVTDAALAQAGIVRAYTLREMLEMCKAFSLPMLKGRNVAVMAGSGGLALIGEDTVQRQGLGLARLSEDLLREIADMGTWKRRNITNPVDLGGFFNTQDILNALDRILSQVEVDGAALSLFRTKEYNAPLSCSEFVDQIEGTSKRHSKPIALHFVSDFFPWPK